MIKHVHFIIFPGYRWVRYAVLTKNTANAAKSDPNVISIIKQSEWSNRRLTISEVSENLNISSNSVDGILTTVSANMLFARKFLSSKNIIVYSLALLYSSYFAYNLSNLWRAKCLKSTGDIKAITTAPLKFKNCSRKWQERWHNTVLEASKRTDAMYLYFYTYFLSNLMQVIIISRLYKIKIIGARTQSCNPTIIFYICLFNFRIDCCNNFHLLKNSNILYSNKILSKS